MIAAVSMPNCPFARVGRIATTASRITATFRSVGRYEGCAFVSIASASFLLRHVPEQEQLAPPENDCAAVRALLRIRRMNPVSSRQRPRMRLLYPPVAGGLRLPKRCRAQCALLPGVVREHFLHECLAAEIGRLSLGGQEWMDRGAHRNWFSIWSVVWRLTCCLDRRSRLL